jgi:hypothetical protein
MNLRSCLAGVVVVVSGLVSFPVLGQQTPGTPRQLTGVQTAQKQVTDAEVNLKKAQVTLAQAHDKIKAKYLTKPEWAPVNADLLKAQNDVKNAHRVALAAVHSKPEYVELAKQREEAEKIQQQAQAAAKPGSDEAKVSNEDLNKAFQDSLKYSVNMKSMEQQALSNDQPYIDAMARVDANKAKLAELDAEVDESMKTDTEYQALQQAVTEAQTQVETAKQAVVAARQQQTSQPRQPRSK